MVRVKFIGNGGGLDHIRSKSVGGERALVPLGEIARPSGTWSLSSNSSCYLLLDENRT